MVNNAVLDSKLKSLIHICKETNNYKKLAVVSFILISNKLDDIGVKLGLRPRNRRSDEQIFQYLKIINSILSKNFQFTIFKKDEINLIKTIEIEFVKRKGDIPFKYIKEIFNFYYELRKISIPNLYDQFKEELIPLSSDIKLYSFLNPKKKGKTQKSNDLKPLLLQKIKERELSTKNKLEKRFDKELFEKAIYLKKIKSSIENPEKDKITINGNLKENIKYQLSMEEIIGYWFIGVFLLFFLLGFVIIFETITYPSLTGTLSFVLISLFGPGALFFLIYWYYFRKEVD